MRRPSRAVAVLETVLALALLAGLLRQFLVSGMRERLLDYAPTSAERLNGGEGWLFGMLLVLGLPAGLLLGDAARRLLPGSRAVGLVFAHPRAVTAILAACAGLFALVATRFVFRGSVFTDDEWTYLFEARALLRGGITTAAEAPREAFRHQFVVAVGGARRAGIFPIGQPALLALGLTVGVPHLTQWLACAAIVWVCGRFAAEVWGSETSVIAAGLTATSPALVLTAGTLHNIVPTVLFSLIALRSTRAVLQGRAAHAAILGAACGAAFVCRPVDGILVASCCAGWLLLAQPTRRALRSLAGATLAGLPWLSIHLLTYRAISGSIFVSPYAVWIRRDWPNARLFGFGRATIWGYDHSFGTAVNKTVAVAIRMSSWAFGWPGLSLLGLAVMPLLVRRDPRVRVLAALVVAHAVTYFFYAFAAVHDFGSYYHLLALPPLALMTARAIVELGAKRNPGAFALGLTLAGLASVWPMQLLRLATVAERVRRPLVAAHDAAADGPIVVFYDSIRGTAQPDRGSWVYYAPLPAPGDRVLWAQTVDTEVRRAVARAHPDRRPLVLEWTNGTPVLRPF